MSTNPHGSRLHLDVAVELGAEPITGTVRDGTGPEVDFTGWLELMSAVETVTGRAPTPLRARREDQR